MRALLALIALAGGCVGKSFRFVAGAPTEKLEWSALSPGGQVVSFGEDSAGELYVLSSNGSVWRIIKGS